MRWSSSGVNPDSGAPGPGRGHHGPICSRSLLRSERHPGIIRSHALAKIRRVRLLRRGSPDNARLWIMGPAVCQDHVVAPRGQGLVGPVAIGLQHAGRQADHRPAFSAMMIASAIFRSAPGPCVSGRRQARPRSRPRQAPQPAGRRPRSRPERTRWSWNRRGSNSARPKPWSPDELRALQRLVAQHRSWKDIALTLNRSISSVQRRARERGLSKSYAGLGRPLSDGGRGFRSCTGIDEATEVAGTN